ncbi:uncharacterized protein LOC143300340 [Babylonia areolata]|uniref:uncharacterized protein LOC143300340 n=1 Tax=Babylonia areolata TaxID=304850 RepID=UPI003FD339DE
MVLSIFIFVFIVLCCPSKAEDFDDNTLGYEFIYHDEKDLLLVKNADSCYYTHVPDIVEPMLTDAGFMFLNVRFSSEAMIIGGITTGITTSESTLEAMRNKFQDLLADFHCQDKKIYEFVWHP